MEAFEECELELPELLSCNDSFVCLCGDVNARTGGLHDELEYTIFNDFWMRWYYEKYEYWCRSPL